MPQNIVWQQCSVTRMRTCGSYNRTKRPFLRRSTTVSGSFQTSRSLNHFSSSASVFNDAARKACADEAIHQPAEVRTGTHKRAWETTGGATWHDYQPATTSCRLVE